MSPSDSCELDRAAVRAAWDRFIGLLNAADINARRLARSRLAPYIFDQYIYPAIENREDVAGDSDAIWLLACRPNAVPYDWILEFERTVARLMEEFS